MTHTTRAPIDPDDSEDADRTAAAEEFDAWDDHPSHAARWDDDGTWPREDHAEEPWFLPSAADLPDEEEIDEREWIRQAEAIPFVRRCRLLRDVVGAGRRLTDSGVLPNATVRDLKQRAGIVRPGGRLREIPELLGPWIVLLELGVLVIDEGNRMVRRRRAAEPGAWGVGHSGDGPWGGWDGPWEEDDGPWDEDDGTWGEGTGQLGGMDGEIDGVIAIAELLYAISCCCPAHGGFRSPHLLLESLLAATCEDGLALPELPADGCLDEAAIARLFRGIGANPALTRDPLDEQRDEVDVEAVEELADVQRDLRLLQAYGILSTSAPGRSGIVFRAPRPVRTAVALLLLRHQRERAARQEALARVLGEEGPLTDPPGGRGA